MKPDSIPQVRKEAEDAFAAELAARIIATQR